MFANPNDAKNLRWHVNERKCDAMYRHPADSIKWMKFDDEFPEFGKESRNIRHGLATDRMNLFGNMSTNHSSWPVLLVNYNLPLGLCMKRKYMMLSMMISSPKQSGNDILKYLTDLLMKLSSFMPCYFAPSMTFRHMVTYQVIVLRVIKHVQYAKKTLLLNN